MRWSRPELACPLSQAHSGENVQLTGLYDFPRNSILGPDALRIAADAFEAFAVLPRGCLRDRTAQGSSTARTAHHRRSATWATRPSAPTRCSVEAPRNHRSRGMMVAPNWSLNAANFL